MVITESTDALAPSGARASVGIVMPAFGSCLHPGLAFGGLRSELAHWLGNRPARLGIRHTSDKSPSLQKVAGHRRGTMRSGKQHGCTTITSHENNFPITKVTENMRVFLFVAVGYQQWFIKKFIGNESKAYNKIWTQLTATRTS